MVAIRKPSSLDSFVYFIVDLIVNPAQNRYSAPFETTGSSGAGSVEVSLPIGYKVIGLSSHITLANNTLTAAFDCVFTKNGVTQAEVITYAPAADGNQTLTLVTPINYLAGIDSLAIGTESLAGAGTATRVLIYVILQRT